jgi:ribosomal protein L9
VYATEENKLRRLVDNDGVAAVRPAQLYIGEQLSSLPKDRLVIRAPVKWNGSLFVTPTDVRKLLEANEVFLDNKAIIQFETPITTAGAHTMQVAGTSLTVEVLPLSRE